MSSPSLDPWIQEAICTGEYATPFDVLGLHGAGERLTIRAWLPGAQQVHVLDARNAHEVATLIQRDARGFFEGPIPRHARPFPYRFRVFWRETISEEEDPYRFGPILTPDDMWMIGEGTHRYLWRVLGAHPKMIEDVGGVSFAVWAPNAKRVSVVGDFNFWDPSRHVMRHRHECGVWEIFIPAVDIGQRYKFDILDYSGTTHQKADPFAFQSELRPATASRILPALPTVDRKTANQGFSDPIHP